jgi:cytochrome c oxidase subunit 3
MSPEQSILSPEEHVVAEGTVLVRHRLEEQYATLEQQHDTATLGMWVFLVTEVMFFGTLFLGLGVYRLLYPVAFETASGKLNWITGGVNTIVLLTSSVMMGLAVHYAKIGDRRRVVLFLTLTCLLGVCFLCLKGLEYVTDYRDNLIPGWKFDPDEWIHKEGLAREQVPHVKLFLLFYWIMTGFHALHVTIGIACVAGVAYLAQRGHFSAAYNTPVEVVGLYWHFVDIVWIFLLPMLYILGTHGPQDFHF